MTNIIVAFPKIEYARSLKAVLVRNGYHVVSVCRSGSYVISEADSLESGIVVCGQSLTDMHYTELRENLPRNFQMLLVAPPGEREDSYDSIVLEPLPLRVASLLQTLQMMIATVGVRRRRREKPREHSEAEQQKINQAKALLMDKNNMSEEEAHRFLQKKSMESGNSMIETADMVLLIYG